MDDTHYDYCTSRLRLSLPGGYEVPTFIRNESLPHPEFADLIEVLLGKINDTISHFENSVLWHTQSKIILENLASYVAPVIDSLAGISIKNLHVIKNDNEKFQNYHDYFHISEKKEMDVLHLAKQDAVVVYWMINEMKNIGIDEFEVINFLNAVSLRWNLYLEVANNSTSYIKEGSPIKLKAKNTNPCVDNTKVSISFSRWFLCHYDFALNVIHTRHHLMISSKNYKEANYEAAAAAIRSAGTLIRGTSADLVFGTKIPKVIYQDIIRPSMGNGFTGEDNPQWSAFSASLTELIKVVSLNEIPVINRALENFLENYLQDIEVHVWVAAKQVGGKPSLTGEEIDEYMPADKKMARPATEGLRNLHYLRLKKFEFLKIYELYKLFNTKK